VRDIAERGGATVILSTHTLPEVEEICTTVLILDGGRAIASGTVSEITRSVGVQRSGRLRVPIDLVGRAKKALAEVDSLAPGSADRWSDVLAFSLTAGEATTLTWGVQAANAGSFDVYVVLLPSAVAVRWS
jgi:ABC-2 type transport system ATP-binding protein